MASWQRSHTCGELRESHIGQMVTLNGWVNSCRTYNDQLFIDMLDEHLAPMPGLFELLDHIERSGLPKGVATSSDRRYLRRILSRYEILERFHMTLTAEDVTEGKPHPEIYLKAAERLCIEPEEMLVLEDSHNGTKAAAAAGAHIISIPHRYSAHQDFSPARHVASSLIDPHVLNLLQP